MSARLTYPSAEPGTGFARPVMIVDIGYETFSGFLGGAQMRLVTVALASVAVLGLAACSSSSGGNGKPTLNPATIDCHDPNLTQAQYDAACGLSHLSTAGPTDTSAPPLRPAQDAAPHTDTTLGQKVKLDDTTNVVFYSYDLKTSEQTNTNPYLLVKLRIENTGTQAQPYPDLGVVCANSSDPSGLWSGGELDTSKPLPARSFDQGTVEVVLVGDHFSGDDSHDSCKAPAYLVAQSNGGDFNQPARSVRVPLSEALIEQMNTLVAKDNAANGD